MSHQKRRVEAFLELLDSPLLTTAQAMELLNMDHQDAYTGYGWESPQEEGGKSLDSYSIPNYSPTYRVASKCSKCTPVDTGFSKTWCKHCDRNGAWVDGVVKWDI